MLMFLVKLCITLALAVGVVYLYTWIHFRLELRTAVSCGKKNPNRPPLLPYCIPYVGSTLGFANQNIGEYWQWLLARSKQFNVDAVAIILGGTRTNLIYSPEGVSALFKARKLTRYELDQQLGVNALGMSDEDAEKVFPRRIDGPGLLTTERIHSDSLLNQHSVNKLTSKFLDILQTKLDSNKDLATGIELSLFAWMKPLLTKITLDALAGPKLLEMYPGFPNSFWLWDQGLMSMIYGTPKMFASSAYDARDKAVGQLETWLSTGYSQMSQDKEDVDWEPIFGAQVMRRRHEYYRQQKMSIRGQAGGDLVFLGGALSNVIPATGWLMLHLLTPINTNWLRQVIIELHSVRNTDKHLDIAALSVLPVLNACFAETLRLHVDLLVTRKAEDNVTLGHHIVRSGEMAFAPTWMTHRDPQYFDEPEKFDPGRFLTVDSKTQKVVFSTTTQSSYYYPFGGGHYMCPGRHFAKQEVFSTVAMLLLDFDITFINFVSSSGEELDRDMESFPKPKKNLPGNVVVDIDGDMRVTIRRKRRTY